MWSAVVYEEEKSSPCSRSKHTVTQLGNYLYLLAGRNGNVPLKDFWRYDLGKLQNTYDFVSKTRSIKMINARVYAFRNRKNVISSRETG